MPELISCVNNKHGVNYLTCSSCEQNLVFKVSSFDKIDSLIEEIIIHAYESTERTWDIEKSRFIVNLVINESIINAVEHGILNIGYEEKKKALENLQDEYTKFIENKWLEKNTPVTVSLCVDSERILLGFHDNGNGFDYHEYAMKPFGDERRLEPSGKGLAILKGLGVIIQWNDKGNAVFCAIPDEALSTSKTEIDLSRIFQIGLEQFDSQHKNLFKIINELIQNLSSNQDRESTGKVLSSLLDYTVVHFRNEEELMDKFGYPNYETHKKQHEFLAARVKEICRKFQTDGVVINEETVGFLVKWLQHHIARVDKEYVPFLKSKGIL